MKMRLKSGAAMSQIILSPMWHYDRRGVMIVPNDKKSNLSFITIEPWKGGNNQFVTLS